MKSAVLALVFASLLGTPAFAAECKDDIAKIDQALASSEIPAAEKAEIEDMRNQAVQLCGAGNEAEGLDVTAEAKARLQIE